LLVLIAERVRKNLGILRGIAIDVKEAIRSLLEEMILPEFEQMRAEQARIGERLKFS
jgi:hypothetical protein